MNERNQIECLFQENNNYIAKSFSKSSLQQYKFSLQSESNVASNILLQDIWNINNVLLDSKTLQLMVASSNNLMQNNNTKQLKNWRSSISDIDPELLFEKSLPKCKHCDSDRNYLGIDQFQRNECTCDLAIAPVTNESTKEISEYHSSMFDKNLASENSSQESKPEGQRQFFKPRFGKYTGKLAAPSGTFTRDSNKVEENRLQNSNVSKITFRTAKEQFLSVNPAAKRTLGASKKAQTRFVSPMIEVQEKQEAESKIIDDRLKHIDPKMIELIESEIIDKGTRVGWDDIAGLQLAKSVIQEAVVLPLLRPDIFTGLRKPPKGILLFGPPGTGKTLIGKCVAAQCNATFFSISASSLTSKWIGDGEKMVRALFAVARCHQPAVVFIDEIDSLLSQRNDSEHEATRRIKTEFLVQFDGAATGEDDCLLIVGATNRPQELDEAARRRLVKRLYIPLPEVDARKQIISNLLKNENNEISSEDIAEIAKLTEGYSGADMKSLCSEAAMGPVRSVPLSQIITIEHNKVRPVCLKDFINALQRVRPSVSQDDLGQYVNWNNTYGQGF